MHQVKKEFTNITVLHLFNAFGGHKVDDLSGHAEVLWSHVAQSDPVLGEKSGQRMHSATMFQVTYHGNLRLKQKLFKLLKQFSSLCNFKLLQRS